MTKQTYEDGDTVTYTYDNSGALATVKDSATGRTTTYYYDFTDRLMKYVEKDTGYTHSVGYEYDDINNLTALVDTINGVKHTTSYAYDDDNRVTSVTAGLASRTYGYDGFSRVNSRVTKHNGSTLLTDTLTYRTPTATTTSGQIATLRSQASGYDVTSNYTYDDNGNILSVSDGDHTSSYVYDTANQLIRENNQKLGKTWVWEYDNAGNIKSRKEYAYTTGSLGEVLDTITYTYGNSNWGDLLTKLNGETIHYDTVGNPLTDNSHTYTWEHGRQLGSLAVSTDFAILYQPEDVYCLPTGIAHFQVEAVGTNLTYQWQWKNGSTWRNSTASGATTNAIQVGAAGDNGTIYRCVVTDGSGNVRISESATLRHAPIVITAQPESFFGTEDDTAVISVEAEGTDLSYVWQWKNGSTWTNSAASGAATNTIRVGASGDNGTTYRCVITDGAGNTVTSGTATIHTDPLRVMKHPEDAHCLPDGYAYFTVEVYGTDLSYQWQWQAPGSSSWSASTASGATTDTIRVGADGDNHISYRCVITDGAGNTVTSEAGTIIPAADTWKYTYNADGLRTCRSNGSTTYDYVYSGDRLAMLTITDELDGSCDTLRFSYDASGTPLSMTFNGTDYYYVTNIQGDIMAILNTSGTAVVEYTYDAWGNIHDVSGSLSETLGEVNPLTYRGYVYDRDSGYYYLQSRYYHPEMGRFINADNYPTTGQGLTGNNMFAYCLNNPVNGCDPCGTCFHRWDFWNDCEECGGQTIKEKLIDYYENGLTLNGSLGLYGSANLGAFNITGSVELAVDLKGNIQIIGSGSFDTTTSGSLFVSGGATASLYAMPDTSYYAGDTYYTGGSVAVPNPACPAVAVGAGGNVGKTSDGYWGINGSLGVGTVNSTGVELHGGYSKTVALTKQFNVFELLFSLF